MELGPEEVLQDRGQDHVRAHEHPRMLTGLCGEEAGVAVAGRRGGPGGSQTPGRPSALGGGQEASRDLGHSGISLYTENHIYLLTVRARVGVVPMHAHMFTDIQTHTKGTSQLGASQGGTCKISGHQSARTILQSTTRRGA